MMNEKPVYLLAGGPGSDRAAMASLLSRAFGPAQKPQVAYIGAANGDNMVFHMLMKALLMQAGAGKVVFVRLAKEKIRVDDVKRILSSSDIIFLAGGEVEDGMVWLRRHGLVAFLKELYDGNKQFVGMSAGSIMLGSHWVRWENPDDAATAELFDCIGLVPFIFDTHAEDEDWIELKTALKLMGNGASGYAIPSGGAVSADSRGVVNVEKVFLTYVNDNGEILYRE